MKRSSAQPSETVDLRSALPFLHLVVLTLVFTSKIAFLGRGELDRTVQVARRAP
jgi:hypothetical protein